MSECETAKIWLCWGKHHSALVRLTNAVHCLSLSRKKVAIRKQPSTPNSHNRPNSHPWMAHSWATQDYQTSKILNNIINITPPPGLLKPSKNRGHYIATRCRIKTAVFSFYPRAIRIWNMIPPHITAIENPIGFQAAIMNLPFPTPIHLNCL